MIEVEMKLNPFGSNVGEMVIGNVYIANIGKGKTEGCSNYVYMVYEPASPFSEEVVKHGEVRDHYRMQATSKLLQAVMLDYGKTGTIGSEHYAKYWLDKKHGGEV